MKYKGYICTLLQKKITSVAQIRVDKGFGQQLDLYIVIPITDLDEADKNM